MFLHTCGAVVFSFKINKVELKLHPCFFSDEYYLNHNVNIFVETLVESCMLLLLHVFGDQIICWCLVYRSPRCFG